MANLILFNVKVQQLKQAIEREKQEFLNFQVIFHSFDINRNQLILKIKKLKEVKEYYMEITPSPNFPNDPPCCIFLNHQSMKYDGTNWPSGSPFIPSYSNCPHGLICINITYEYQIAHPKQSMAWKPTTSLEFLLLSILGQWK